MTHPYGPASNPYGAGYSPLASGNRPPLESAASTAIAAARNRLESRQRPPVPPPAPKLSEEDRKAAAEVIAAGGGCRLCGGLHASGSEVVSTCRNCGHEVRRPDELACPRLASFTVDGDGWVTSATFWPGTDWAKGRVIFAEDSHETPHGEDAEDA